MSHVLILEDEAVIRGALKRFLERQRYHVADAESVEQAGREFDLGAFDLIIADLRLPGAPGVDIIEQAAGVPVLIMTSYSSVPSAVECMKRGAADYIAKPFDHDELLMLVKRILSEQNLARQNRALKIDLQRSYPVGGMIGGSPRMAEVFEKVRKVAPTDATVLILGESGTGKELVARALHDESRRREAPIITVNCAAIPEGLIESELFGHEKGAFTGAVAARHGMVEAASCGTLFLDEIGELPLAAQARLLRVLQDGEIRRVGSPYVRRVDMRLVAATHRDLRQAVSAGQFRGDLFFRLCVVEIRLPPLRERGGDVLKLADYMLAKACRKLHRGTVAFTREARHAIKAYRWPGNVRELENAIERAVILADTGEVTPELLAIDPQWADNEMTAPEGTAASLSLDGYFRRFVREHELRLSETEIAARLGISRKSLWERRRRLGIPRKGQ